ncbi:WSC domain-containing protein [Truncatella angustata]|uniref:WSC domain-containing protein n=1 Tax=Truncatella angustata TaxID=152316 RepID=A0A9P8UKL9_9PEZI|nr:WSC domain-containing protein [Truncatella angustata]KAH6653843.1 WSC domain-containing protein [Truncatella angustata]
MMTPRILAAIAAFSLVNKSYAWYNELPPCLDEFQPFVPAGCFDNGQTGEKEALSMKTDLPVTGMTTEICVAECKGNGFRYAGLAWYGSCYCGQTVDRALVDNDQCSLPCDGNSNETCGGNTQINIYQDPTFLPVNETTVEEYVALGCYTDSSTLGKALFYKQELAPGDVTTETCLASCLAGGFPFAGTEYGQECYCGVVLGNQTAQADIAECAMSCNGNPSQICGGPDRLTLYVAKDLLSLEPCGYEPPPISSSTASTSSSTTLSSLITSSTTFSSITTSSDRPLTSISTLSTGSYKTTTYPVTTTTKTSTSSTVTVPLCTATTTSPPTCEYKCGKWCSTPLPDWNDSTSCLIGWSSCALQVTSCFSHAGWPDVMDCFNFLEWCGDIQNYCTGSCSKGKSCGGKSECFKEIPPANSKPGTTSTSVYPCTTTKTTSTKSSSTTSSKPTSSYPVPTPTGVCKQPVNSKYGYDTDHPVGDIKLPVVTCNNLESDYRSGNVFKLYTESDSKTCPSYPRSKCPTACAEACKAQYNDCLGVYAEGCKTNGKSGDKSYGTGYYSARKNRHRDYAAPERPKRRTLDRFSESYESAALRCKQQYIDCLDANKAVAGTGKCTQYGEGW